MGGKLGQKKIKLMFLIIALRKENMNKKMNSTKYSAKQILYFYIAYLFSHNYSKNIFLKKKKINKKKK